jgi:hypothetical protein
MITRVRLVNVAFQAIEAFKEIGLSIAGACVKYSNIYSVPLVRIDSALVTN